MSSEKTKAKSADKDALISDIQRLNRKHPGVTRNYYRANGTFSEAQWQQVFPTFKEFLLAAGLEEPESVELSSDERDGNTRTVTKTVDYNVQTLEQLAEACSIDTSEWEIHKWRCSAWGGTTGTADKFSVSASMRLKENLIAAKSEVEDLRQKALTYAPKYVPYTHKSFSSSGNLLEISLYDHHFGALIWGKETGGADYDSKIATDCWEKALSALVQRTKAFEPERVLVVLGNDQQNVDNPAGTTTAGTPQNSDSRYQKMFGVSKEASIWAIDSLTTVAKNVDVICVPGNHDYLSTWHLGDTLQSWFKNAPNVTVNNDPTFRKYYQYGNVLLMLTHGNKGKLEDYDKTMAAEQPKLWGETKWREAHTGDKHHRRLIELKGATVRILPSLRPPCAWTSENHFVGAIRAAEAYVWSKEEGLIGTACYSIL